MKKSKFFLYNFLEFIFKKLEQYLYDEIPRTELERKCGRMKRIIEELQGKYEDETIYMY